MSQNLELVYFFPLPLIPFVLWPLSPNHLAKAEIYFGATTIHDNKHNEAFL